MARCPFAVWTPITGSSGPHLGGPYKIVHHTTEGSTAAGAMRAYREKRCDPHFTVDSTTIYQHIDTSMGARALVNMAGGVQTNRDSAIQIELVGFAHRPKDEKALVNLAKLCRWIEATHGVPRVWPSGPPKPAKNGRDPGGHNRDPLTWDTKGGHYGHCHVPENTHWDPAYTAEEVAFLDTATFDERGRLVLPPTVARATRRRAPRAASVSSKPIRSTMPDHADVPVGVSAYIRDLPMGEVPEWPAAGAVVRRKPRKAAKKAGRRRSSTARSAGEAKVNVGSVLSFADGLNEQDLRDVLYSVQLAQRGASGSHNRFTETQAWYQKYLEILENLGWATEQFAFTRFDQSEGELRMDQAALKIITAIATGGQLLVLQESVKALEKLADSDGTIKLFDHHSSRDGSGNFQLGAVQRSVNGALSMALGAFYFRSVDQRKRFLFWKWGARDVHFWTAAQRMTLNTDLYARWRDDVIAKLQAEAPKFIADLKLGG